MRNVYIFSFAGLVALLMGYQLPANAQNVEDPVPFEFYSNGQYKVFAPHNIKVKDVRVKIDNDADPGHPYVYDFKFHADKNTFTPAGAPNQKIGLQHDDIVKRYKQLAARMMLALNNLDDSMALQRLYKKFWGEANFGSIRTELSRLSRELNEGVVDKQSCPVNYPHFKGICELENELTLPYAPYQVAVNLNTDSTRYDIYIARTDWFHECLRNYWHKILNGSSLHDQKVDHDYQKSWQELEGIANTLIRYSVMAAKAGSLSCEAPDNLDELTSAIKKFETDTLAGIGNKPVIQLINNNLPLYQSTFWYNYGFFGMDPLGYTTPDRGYRVYLYLATAAQLHDKAVSEKLSNATGCCKMSIAGIDSLIRQLNSGTKVFSTDTTVVDPIWGYNDLDALRTSTKVQEHFEIPVTLHARTPQLMMQFDAAQHYYSDPYNHSYKSIATTDSMNFVVYNIKGSTQVTIPQTVQSTTNTSAFQDALAGLSGAGGLVTASGLLSLALFNTPAPQINKAPTLKVKVQAATIPIGRGRTAPNTNITTVTILDSQTHETKRLDIVADMSDRDILFVYLNKADPEAYKPALVDYFFQNCFPNTRKVLTTIGIDKIPAHVEDLLKAYYHFIAIYKKTSDALAGARQTFTDYQWVADLAAISDRSLPPLPADLGAETDSTPVYQSQIYPIPILDSTRSIQASIVEKKPGKKDTTTTTYAVSPIRIGKKVRFALSAGIAVTTNTYYQKTVSIVNNQLSVTNNANNVSYEAGFNIYPSGFFQIDNSFMGLKSNRFKNRLSIFAGLGLPNPLKNYYAGGGIDLVPGFKLLVGGHLFLNTRYQLVNNQIAAQANGVKWAGPFVAFNIDPAALLTLLGIFK